MVAWTLDRLAAPPRWHCSGDDAIAAFSTRQGGVSAPPYDSLNLGRSTADDPAAIEFNRAHLLRSLALDPDRLATAGQVHGAAVTRVHAPGLHRECDALVTTVSDLPLAVSSADCLPVLVAARGAIGAAHSGWRGTTLGIAVAVLDAVCAASGTRVDQATIHLGPGVRGCCYQVGPEVAEQFPATCVSRRGESLYLDVPQAVRMQLLEHGVLPEQLHDVGACTMCQPDWYFSHRRDRGLTGRQWGVIARREGP